VQGAGAHHGRQVQAVRQGIDPVEHALLEDAHPAGRIGDALRAHQADQVGKDEVPQTAHRGHLAVRTRHARSDHDVCILLQRHAAKGRKVLGRVGAVGIQEADPLPACGCKPRLKRRAIAAVDLVAQQPDPRQRPHDFGSPVARAVVHHDQLELVDPDRGQLGSHAEHALRDCRDPIFFVVRRNYH